MGLRDYVVGPGIARGIIEESSKKKFKSRGGWLGHQKEKRGEKLGKKKKKKVGKKGRAAEIVST